ncbi:hypothetical protein [Nocardia amikacinitolerans]|uniref:hypothetical protein n=1 Tax=Nocardia amikacinitolerans TaxID=756689 RepID=UPI00082F7BDF|nr:hypothetical protein [Nocardia amikacinitolerans]MCP2280917.1 hypothetical protein [Nocardia amikacinitolerans]MCP2315695.1 hypothetical protein [Nocardia amikacinitolerans]
MGIAALITWLLTAGGGSVLLGTWIAKGGAREPTASHLPPAVVFGHFLLAAAGLIVWIIYLIADSTALAWIAFALLVPVAALGFGMLARWLPVYRARTAEVGDATPPERHFPVAIVAAHGVLAVTTVVLVLLTALGVGAD